MPIDPLDRLPPHNADAEASVLGSIILEPSRLDDVADIVAADDFYVDGHQVLYGHMLAMREGDIPVDGVTLLTWLRDAGDMARIGNEARLGEMVQAATSHYKHYAGTIAEQSRRRRIIQAASRMLEAGYDQAKPIDEAVGDCEAALQKIPTGKYDGEPVAFPVALEAACTMIDEIAKHQHMAGTMTELIGLHMTPWLKVTDQALNTQE